MIVNKWGKIDKKSESIWNKLENNRNKFGRIFEKLEKMVGKSWKIITNLNEKHF